MTKLNYLTIVLGALCAINAKANDKITLQLPNMIRAAEIKYELPKGIMQALIKTESNFNYKAFVAHDGSSNLPSYGLAQIQLDAAHLVQRIKARENGVRLNKKDLITPKRLMNPETNVEYAAAYLRWILNNHKNNIALSLSCYNAGVNSSICKNKKYSPYVGLVLNAWIQKTEEPKRILADIK